MLMADDGGANIKETQDSLIYLETAFFDYILTNVPYGAYAGEADINSFSLTNNKRLELLFVEKIISALRPGGRAAVIVPDGLIESTSLSQFRESLLRKINLESVISLPPFIFEPYTPEKTYVLIFHRKMVSEEGRFQSTPMWHFIVDNDGFQDGKKRYPIHENDLPLLEGIYCQENIPYRCRFVNMNECTAENYYTFASENYLRKMEPIEVTVEVFQDLINNIKKTIYNG
jgi:type I restriction-modification system DNA methylase subunit